MSARREVHPDCDGGVFCPVPGHVQTYQKTRATRTFSHAPLTPGQRKTIRERRKAAQEEH